MRSGSDRSVPPGSVSPSGPLHLGPSPHIHAPDSTAKIMWTVSATLVPVVGLAVWHFGPSALLVVLAATLGALATERLFGPRGGPGGAPGRGPGAGAGGGRTARGRAAGGGTGFRSGVLRAGSLRDGSALLTGLLLGLTLPPGLPLWMAALGGVVAIGFGKLVFGGLGQNVFNPALLGRAFLQAAFPTALTTWPAPLGPDGGLYASTLALPLLAPAPVDAVTAATPLGAAKFGGEIPELASLALGTTSGSLGETAGILILVCGAYLAVRRYLNWRIPVSILVTVAVLSGLLHALDPGHPGPLVMLLSGGLMLGAVYMATDMVTSPVTDRGAWIFGAGIGLLVVLIRVWGGLPEGVMYAILFMNALVPAIDRITRPVPLGARREGEAGA